MKALILITLTLFVYQGVYSQGQADETKTDELIQVEKEGAANIQTENPDSEENTFKSFQKIETKSNKHLKIKTTFNNRLIKRVKQNHDIGPEMEYILQRMLLSILMVILGCLLLIGVLYAGVYFGWW